MDIKENLAKLLGKLDTLRGDFETLQTDTDAEGCDRIDSEDRDTQESAQGYFDADYVIGFAVQDIESALEHLRTINL